MDDTLMTVGELSRRTGMSPKLIRRFTDAGLIYSPGRSEADYRLYETSAVWCVETISTLRSLGLTIREIEELASVYLDDERADGREVLVETLRNAKARSESKMADLEEVKSRQEQALNYGVNALIAPDPTRT